MTKRNWITVLLALAALLACQPLLAAAHEGKASQPDATFTFKTKGMKYIGVGGAIDGKVNPTLKVARGERVRIKLVNGDGLAHDIAVPAFDAKSSHVLARGSSTEITFRAGKPGEFEYYCTVPGHRLAGMRGKIVVGAPKGRTRHKAADVSRDPADVAPRVGKRPAKTVDYTIEAYELKGQLADETTYTYWTYDKKVPGPMLRVRVGDTVNIHFKNAESSTMQHDIDFHAVIGPGGGSKVLREKPGEEKTLTFKALKPGVYVYHCAVPMVAEHIANGMFGLIVVVPKGGLPKVDKEFYVMQSELYTTGGHGRHGYRKFDKKRILHENPDYFVFNGTVGGLVEDHPLTAKTGDKVRIFFGDAGPNLMSSFHVIGEIFDKVYQLGSLVSPPLRDVQTVPVPPGSATMVEFQPKVPGEYTLVDHAMSRMDLGLKGVLEVRGKPRPDIYQGAK